MLFRSGRESENLLLTAMLLVGSVGALFAMVAFLKFGNAFLAVGTSEFRKVARSPGTTIFVRLITAVEVAIAFLLFRNAQIVATLDVITLAISITYAQKQ